MCSRLGMFVVVLGLAVAGHPGATVAQNLLINGDFDTDLNEWRNAGGTLWDAMDRSGDPSSGSARNIPTSVPTPTARDIFSCAPVVPGVEYDFGASTFIPSAAVDVTTAVWAQFVDSDVCQFGSGATAVGGSPLISTVIQGSWVDLASSVVAPPGAVHVWLRLRYEQPANAVATDEVFFDSAFVVPEPGGAASWMAVICVLAALGARPGEVANRLNRVDGARRTRHELPSRGTASPSTCVVGLPRARQASS